MQIKLPRVSSATCSLRVGSSPFHAEMGCEWLDGVPGHAAPLHLEAKCARCNRVTRSQKDYSSDLVKDF
jgi:hypothetical protein